MAPDQSLVTSGHGPHRAVAGRPAGSGHVAAGGGAALGVLERRRTGPRRAGAAPGARASTQRQPADRGEQAAGGDPVAGDRAQQVQRCGAAPAGPGGAARSSTGCCGCRRRRRLCGSRAVLAWWCTVMVRQVAQLPPGAREVAGHQLLLAAQPEPLGEAADLLERRPAHHAGPGEEAAQRRARAASRRRRRGSRAARRTIGSSVLAGLDQDAGGDHGQPRVGVEHVGRRCAASPGPTRCRRRRTRRRGCRAGRRRGCGRPRRGCVGLAISSTQGCRARTASAVPSVEPLSTTTTCGCSGSRLQPGQREQQLVAALVGDDDDGDPRVGHGRRWPAARRGRWSSSQLPDAAITCCGSTRRAAQRRGDPGEGAGQPAQARASGADRARSSRPAVSRSG